MAEKHQKKSKTTEIRGEKVRTDLKQTRRYMRQTEKIKVNREAHTRGSYDMRNKARRRQNEHDDCRDQEREKEKNEIERIILIYDL